MSEEKKAHPLDSIFKAYHDGELKLNTVKQHNSEAFTAGEKGAITDEDGKIHYEWFDKGNGKTGDDKKTAKEVQDLFRRTMIDFYAVKITKKSGMEFKDDFEKEQTVEAHYGFSTAQIETEMKQNGSQFNRDYFGQRIAPHLERTIRQKVNQYAAKNLKDEHIGDVVKASGLEGRLSSDLTLEEAKGVLGLYAQNNGIISENDLRQQVGHKIKDTKYGLKQSDNYQKDKAA